MKRREEITQSAKNKYPYIKGLPQSTSNQAVFIEAAEWADRTMIEKACKWLINIDFDDFHFRDCDESFNNDLFVDAFRKAMEE